MRRSVGIGLLVAAAALGQDVSRMDQVVQSYVANKTFMGSVLVARGSEVLLSKGYGSANLEWNVPNSPGAKFRLEAEDGRPGEEVHAGCAGRMGQDHHLPPADAHLGDSEFHGLRRLSLAGRLLKKSLGKLKLTLPGAVSCRVLV